MLASFEAPGCQFPTQQGLVGQDFFSCLSTGTTTSSKGWGSQLSATEASEERKVCEFPGGDMPFGPSQMWKPTIWRLGWISLWDFGFDQPNQPKKHLQHYPTFTIVFIFFFSRNPPKNPKSSNIHKKKKLQTITLQEWIRWYLKSGNPLKLGESPTSNKIIRFPKSQVYPQSSLSRDLRSRWS